MAAVMPERALEALEGCDRMYMVGVRGEGPTVAVESTRTDGEAWSSREATMQADLIDEMIDALLEEQTAILDCTMAEARWR